MSSVNLTWSIGGNADEFKVYRSESPMNVNSMPAPLATGITTKSYSDITVSPGAKYYYRTSSVKNAVEKISSEIKLYAIASSSFIFKSPFAQNIIDEIGKVWTAFGSAAIETAALKLLNSGSTGTDYLRTPISNFSKVFSIDDFTMRMKVKFNRTTGIHVIASCRNYAEGAGFWLGVLDGSLAFATYNNSTSTAVYFQIPISINTTDFFNFSIERKGQKYYLYFNNNQIAKYETVTGIKTPTSTIIGGAGLGIMSDDNRYFLSGYLKDFELISGALGNGGAITPNF